MAGLPGNNISGPLYDVWPANNEDYMRSVIHHEFEHYIQYAKYGDYYRNDTAWTAFNPPSFNYVSSGFACYQNPSSCLSGEHPLSGFVTGYAASGIAEDKADVYAYLMTTKNYADLQDWIEDDSRLAQKVDYYIDFMHSVDQSIDEEYFEDIHEYASLHNTTINQAGVYGVPKIINGVSVVEIGYHQDYSHVDFSIGSKDSEIVINNGIMGDVTVQSDSYLKGSGKVGVLDVLSEAHLAPGQSPGCLTANDTTFEADALFDVEIAGATVCSEYDQLRVVGTVDLGNSILNTSLLDNYKPTKGTNFIIIDNDGNDAVIGTFKDVPEGGSVSVEGVIFSVSYVGGDGNDVTLTVAEDTSNATPPGAPNTGIQLLTTNPLLTLALTVLSAGTLFVLARRYAKL